MAGNAASPLTIFYAQIYLLFLHEAGKGLEAVLGEMGEMDPNWQEFEWEGKTLFVKLNRDNYALENAADDLLRKAGFDPADDEDEDLEAMLNEADGDEPGGRGGLH